MEENRTNDAVEIDLKRVLLALWHKAWVIILAGVLTASLAFGYAWFFITPTYSANTQLYVNNNYAGSNTVSSSQIVAAQNLADTYMVIMRSRSVLKEVIKTAKLPYTYQQLRNMITANAVDNTEVFEVTVTCTDSEEAVKIANTIADVLPGKIADVIEGSSVGIVDYAEINNTPVGPNYKTYGILGGLVGVLISVLAIVVADLLDTGIKSEDYLAQTYGDLPLLAVIPGAQSTKNGYYKGYYSAEPKRQPATKKGGGK